MFYFVLFFHLFLQLIDKLIKLVLALATIRWIFWYDLALLLTSSIAAYAGGDLLLRTWREHCLRLEYYITTNPARITEAIEERQVPEESIRCDNRELIYFKIRNRSKISLLGNRIWITFIPRGFIILDEIDVNALPLGTSLGTLQEKVPCSPLLRPEKPPTFQNLIWGKGKEPTLLMHNIAFYNPAYGNQTIILREDDLFIPVWVKTPKKSGKYEVSIDVKPENINKDFNGKLTLHVTDSPRSLAF